MPATRAGTRAAIKDMDSRIDIIDGQLRSQLDQLRKSINHSLDSKDDESDMGETIRNFEKSMIKTLDSLKREVAELGKMVVGQEEKFQHRQNRNCVLLLGIREERREDLYGSVCTILSKKLEVTVAKGDLDACYRVGKKPGGDGKSRPVVVSFVNRWRRDEVFSGKRALKGSGVVMYEVLTSKCLDLFKKVKRKCGAKRCWTWSGNIYADVNGTKKLIKCEDDIGSI